MDELNEAVLRKVISKRPENSHKGTFGRVLIIGGNQQFGGAGILAASAAVYAGAGLVTVACAKVNHGALHARLPEAMVLDSANLAAVKNQILLSDVVVIGCGLGLEALGVDLLKLVLEVLDKRQFLVMDGSAISLFAENKLTLPVSENVIFTPHEMELQRLSGLEIGAQEALAVQKFTEDLGAIIVAKSAKTRIFAPKKVTQLLTIGTAAQATGGMGDTLAGIIGAFLGQFKGELSEVVGAATYLHSLIASDLAKEAYVVLPSQIIELLPKFMKKYERNH